MEQHGWKALGPSSGTHCMMKTLYNIMFKSALHRIIHCCLIIRLTRCYCTFLSASSFLCFACKNGARQYKMVLGSVFVSIAIYAK